MDFEDPDNDDEDAQKQEKAAKASRAQVDLKLESEAEGKDQHDREVIRARNSVKKIQSNLKAANESRERREKHIGELKSLVQT